MREFVPWNEFTVLLAGISPKTPLGAVVYLRSMTDPKQIAALTAEQRKIRDDWISRRAKKLKSDKITRDDYDKMMHDIEFYLRSVFGTQTT